MCACAAIQPEGDVRDLKAKLFEAERKLLQVLSFDVDVRACDRSIQYEYLR